MMKSPLLSCRWMLIALFIVFSWLLAGISPYRPHQSVPDPAKIAAQNVLEMVRDTDGQWHELAARRPLLVLRLFSGR